MYKSKIEILFSCYNLLLTTLYFLPFSCKDMAYKSHTKAAQEGAFNRFANGNYFGYATRWLRGLFAYAGSWTEKFRAIFRFCSMNHFFLKPDEAHNAGRDAEMTIRLYFKFGSFVFVGLDNDQRFFRGFSLDMGRYRNHIWSLCWDWSTWA